MILKVSKKVIAIVLLFYISCQSLFLQQKTDVVEFLERIRQRMQEIRKLEELRKEKRKKSKERKLLIKKQLMGRLSNPLLLPKGSQKIEHKKHEGKEVKSKDQNINNQQVINDNKTTTSQESIPTKESSKVKSSMIPFKLPSFSDFLKKAKSRSSSESQAESEEQKNQNGLQPTNSDYLSQYMEALKEWYLEISQNLIDFWLFFRIFFLDNEKRFAHLKEICHNSIPEIDPIFSSRKIQGKDILGWVWYWPKEIEKHSMLINNINVWAPLYTYDCSLTVSCYLLDKNVENNCDLNNNLSTTLINKNTLCRNLAEMARFGNCKIGGLFSSIFSCLQDYFQNKSLPLGYPLSTLKRYVNKVYNEGRKYFAYMKQVFAKQMIPQVVEMCYKKCLCEDLGIRCSDKSGIILGSEDIISQILYDTIYKKEFLKILTFAHLFRYIVNYPPWYFDEPVCQNEEMKKFLTQSIEMFLNDLKNLFLCDGASCYSDIYTTLSTNNLEWLSDDVVGKGYANVERALLRDNMGKYKRKIRDLAIDYEKLNKIVTDYISGLKEMKNDQKYCFGIYLSLLSKMVSIIEQKNAKLKTYYNEILTNIKNKLRIHAPLVYRFVKNAIILSFNPSMYNIEWSRLYSISEMLWNVEDLIKKYFYDTGNNIYFNFGVFVYIDFAVAYLERSYKIKKCDIDKLIPEIIVPGDVDSYIDEIVENHDPKYKPFWKCFKSSIDIWKCVSESKYKQDESSDPINIMDDETINILKSVIEYNGESLLLTNLDDFFKTLHQKTNGKVWYEFVDSKWDQCCKGCCEKGTCNPNRPECPKDVNNNCSDKMSYENYCTQKAPSENFREEYLKEVKDFLGEDVFNELRDRISKFKDVLPFSEEALKCSTQ